MSKSVTFEEAKRLVGREFIHFKGNRYKLLAVATHSETMEPFVVYQALYGDHGVWVRPFAMFFETVDREGFSGPRFKLAEVDPADAPTAAGKSDDSKGTLHPPENQSWYLVDVVVAITPYSLWRRCLRLAAAEVWINQMLVAATDPAAAYDKALSQAWFYEDDPPDADGRRLWDRRFKVVGVADLLPVYEDVTDGAELSFGRIEHCWFPRRLVKSRDWCIARGTVS